jgi:hypothetical protein
VEQAGVGQYAFGSRDVGLVEEEGEVQEWRKRPHYERFEGVGVVLEIAADVVRSL